MEEIRWIENWYLKMCDGYWEHSFGIKIETLDNPGWIIKINLEETPMEDLCVPYKLHENSEDDWYGFSIENSLFKAAGDPTKLGFLLSLAKDVLDGKIMGNG